MIDAGQNHYRMRQCSNSACRFRFPTAEDSDEGRQCPSCGAATYSGSLSFSRREFASDYMTTGGLKVIGLLDNIRSSYNVGSIFRTSDGAGIRHLHLCGITTTPARSKVAKTALGAEKSIPWTYHTNSLDAERLIHGQGYQLWALETDRRSESIFDVPLSLVDDPVALVIGNELAGIDPTLLERCDKVIALPMLGQKGSLNVVVAFGIAVYILRFKTAIIA